jgi:hypothetical protein
MVAYPRCLLLEDCGPFAADYPLKAARLAAGELMASESFLENKGAVTSDELLTALKRYFQETGDSERSTASCIGIHRDVLRRLLSDSSGPRKQIVARIALFLRRAGYI